jgi:DNA polymerase III subunit delta'
MIDIEVHSRARRLLARALTQGRLAHSYLLAGPEGAGKRTLARSFAEALLCERRSFPACGKCAACGRVMTNRHPDLHWVEPEGRNVKIDSVRELCGKLTLHSFEGGTKVGIIVEAERMTVEAQNAFLKTLEEPSADTVLMLTTSNLSRLLPTTISRCQVVRLGPMPDAVIARLLVSERGLAPETARLVAALAQGNARRALELDLAFVIEFRRQMVQRLLTLAKDDRPGLLRFAEDLSKLSQSSEEVLDLLAGFYRDALLLSLGRTELQNHDLQAEALALARTATVPAILRDLQTIQQARLRAVGNANSRINYEILTMSLKGMEGAEITPL